MLRIAQSQLVHSAADDQTDGAEFQGRDDVLHQQRHLDTVAVERRDKTCPKIATEGDHPINYDSR